MNAYKEIAFKLNHTKPHKLYIAMAGGGQSFAYHYLKYSGASKTIAGMIIPYGREEFDDFIGYPPPNYVSDETARTMAIRSFMRSGMQVDDEYAIGIGVTCSLATDGERDGRIHKIHIALHCHEYTELLRIHLRQGLTRDQEEEYCCMIIFSMLADIADYEDGFCLDFDPFVYVVDSHHQRVDREDFDTAIPEDATEVAIAPGSWNPKHAGHEGMLDLAQEILGIVPYVELTTRNVDKGIIDYIEVEKRLGNMPYNKLLTSASTFLDKAKLLARPHRTIYFIVGADTWNRILDPTYAGDFGTLYMMFIGMNAKFLVFNRENAPMLSHPLMDEILVEDDRLKSYNVPISSTQIRNGEV